MWKPAFSQNKYFVFVCCAYCSKAEGEYKRFGSAFGLLIAYIARANTSGCFYIHSVFQISNLIYNNKITIHIKSYKRWLADRYTQWPMVYNWTRGWHVVLWSQVTITLWCSPWPGNSTRQAAGSRASWGGFRSCSPTEEAGRDSVSLALCTLPSTHDEMVNGAKKCPYNDVF